MSGALNFIAFCNKTLFSLIDVKIVLYIFETPLKDLKHGSQVFKEFKQKFPIDIKLVIKYPLILKNLVKHIRMRMYRRDVDLKLGIIFMHTDTDIFSLEQHLSKHSRLTGKNNHNSKRERKEKYGKAFEDSLGAMGLVHSLYSKYEE